MKKTNTKHTLNSTHHNCPANTEQRCANPHQNHLSYCDEQKKEILKKYILERGQHYGRIKFRSIWGHRLYERIGGAQLFPDLPENGTVDFADSHLYVAGNLLPK
ncbi:MAG: hypothetical protein P1V20_16775 [Verrucomicrobiales bacterium]|nr:hypothetical protein [Verrucomicrobiales bacterium]